MSNYISARATAFLERNKGLVSKKTLEILWGKWLTNATLHQVVSAIWPKHRPKNWIVLVGSYNSGTTILKEIITSHPDVASFHLEATRYTKVFTRPETLGWTRNWLKIRDYIALPNEKDEPKYQQLLRDLSPLWNRRATHYLEKSITNIERIGWINQNFPNVKFVVILRNGYAATEGMIRKANPTGQAAQAYGKDKYEFSFAGQQWEMGNKHLFEALEKMENYKLIRYEDMCANPQAVLSDLLTWLGLDMQHYRFDGGNIWAGSRMFTLKNRNQNSFKALKPDDIAAFNQAVGPYMQQLGYPLLP